MQHILKIAVVATLAGFGMSADRAAAMDVGGPVHQDSMVQRVQHHGSPGGRIGSAPSGRGSFSSPRTSSRFSGNVDRGARVYGWEGRRHGHRRHGRGIYFAPGYYDYGDYGTYDDEGGCEWMRERAESTGSAYWWRRYRLCVS